MKYDPRTLYSGALRSPASSAKMLLCAAAMEACLGAGGVGLFALAALLRWYGRAQHANCMQPTQFVNGHYGAGCSVRRALRVACMDQESPSHLVPSADLLCIWAPLMGLPSGFVSGGVCGARATLVHSTLSACSPSAMSAHWSAVNNSNVGVNSAFIPLIWTVPSH